MGYENTDKQILEIIQAFACNSSAEVLILEGDSEEWQRLFDRCREQKLIAMAYDRLNGIAECPEELRRAWRNEARRELIVQTEKTETMKALCSKLNEAGIKYFAVKGIVCRDMYAKGETRISGDEDISIDPNDLERCRKVLSDFGMEQMGEGGTDYKFIKKGSSLLIELHTGLFEDKIFSDALNIDWDTGYFINTDRADIRTLSPTENFLYLTFHALKHFLTGGFGIRTACDIGKFAQVYGSQIDWQRVKNITERVNAFKFTCGLLDICAKHFGFSYERACCPKSFVAKLDSDDLLADIMDAGIYGQSTMSRKQSSLITYSAYNKTSFHILRALFPDLKYMENRYDYLKRYPILLPFAWISRFFAYFGTAIKKGSSSNPAESIEIGKKRVRLLKRYGITSEIFEAANNVE